MNFEVLEQFMWLLAGAYIVGFVLLTAIVAVIANKVGERFGSKWSYAILTIYMGWIIWSLIA